jgi:serine/threonine protein kinase
MVRRKLQLLRRRLGLCPLVGFPIDCDFWIPECDVSKRVRKHVEGTPFGPHHEGSASWIPNQELFGDHFPPVNSAVSHLRHQESLLIACATRDVAALRERLSGLVAALDNFNDARSQLECLRFDLRSFEQNKLASTHQQAAEIKTATLHEMRQVSNARKPFVEAYARHVPPSQIVAKTHMEACLVRKEDAAARVKELRLQLARAEEALQSTLAEEESLTQELCSLNEISASFATRILEDEATNEAGAADAIEERFRILDSQIKLQESECCALDSEIDSALHTVQTLQQSWQHIVCTKKDSEMNSRDVRLFFEFLKLEVSPKLIVSNAVDGKVLSTLSAELLCKNLGICSFKDRLVLHHLQNCIKNATLESCVFNVSADSPLSWNVHQVETWLFEQSLPFVVDPFKAEKMNGMALLQLDDVLLQHFQVCASSLKCSQEVWSAIQRLRATSQKPRNLATSGIFQILHSEITDIPRAPVMKGSSGSVQKVKYQGMDAAKKQPHLARTLNDRDRGKFLKELEIAHKARHPYVVSMFGACFDDDGMFLLMEWMEGGSLYDALGNHRTKPIVARKRISIAREISGGLAYLHSCGIVHRDIKSLNILLTCDGHAKLCDFGLATLHTLTTTATSAHEGQQAGTLPWMAPELVLLGSKCNESTDIYSFGIIMYELMTCEVPFEGLNQVQIEAQLKNGLRPQLPDVIPNGFPPKYVELMMSCWNQNASQRPSSQQLQDSLIAMDVSAQVNGPIELYPKDYAVASSVTLHSILQTAMPDPMSQPLITRIATAVRDVFSQAPNFIDRSRAYDLSDLEAHCLCAYTLDARQFNGTREASPFFLYNAALRSRDASLIARWSDFSYVFEAALKKLPDNDCTVYRGLDCPLTEVSHLYEKRKLVWFNSVTSCTMYKQGTMVRYTLCRIRVRICDVRDFIIVAVFMLSSRRPSAQERAAAQAHSWSFASSMLKTSDRSALIPKRSCLFP